MKIKFDRERQGYTVRASNDRFMVCTKPFNLQKTVLYTIVDREKKIRGTENLVFGLGAETDIQCLEMLERLTAGKTEISHRNRRQLSEKEIKSICLSTTQKSSSTNSYENRKAI